MTLQRPVTQDKAQPTTQRGEDINSFFLIKNKSRRDIELVYYFSVVPMNVKGTERYTKSIRQTINVREIGSYSGWGSSFVL
jgi:hypothetical protein